MPDTQAGRTAFLQSMTAAGERLIEWARIERNLQSREMPALRRRIAAIEREARAQGVTHGKPPGGDLLTRAAVLAAIEEASRG